MMAKKFLYFLIVPTIFYCVMGDFNLTIVHISDFHSHWFEFNERKNLCSEEESDSGKCYGGFSRLVTFVKEVRKKEKNVLVLSSGEFFLAKSLNPTHGYRIPHAVLSRLELDAMSLSNHDFTSGTHDLSVYLYGQKFPVLCANMQARNTSYLYSRINASVVLDVGGEKVGIVGYVHRHTLKRSRNAVSLKFVSEITAVKKEVKKLEEEGVNKIILLGHAGYYTDLKMAKKVKGVDIVIGGDSDVILLQPEEGKEPHPKVGNIHENYPRIYEHEDDSNVMNRTLVLHVPRHGKYVGVLSLTFDDNGKIIHESGKPVLMDNSIPQDTDTLSFLKYARKSLEHIEFGPTLPDKLEVLGQALDHLDGEARSCRMRECTLGNFLSDAIHQEYAYRYRYLDSEIEEVDAVILNSGFVRHSIDAGNITLEKLLHSMIFGGFITKVQMSGAELVDAMEHSVRYYDRHGVSPSGAFLQISGLRVVYDLSQTRGKRVKKLEIQCRNCENGTFTEVSPEKIYSIGTFSYIKTGGDGYKYFEEDEEELLANGLLDLNLMIDYLRRIQVITPKLDGRIAFVQNFKKSDTTQRSCFTDNCVNSTKFTDGTSESLPKHSVSNVENRNM